MTLPQFLILPPNTSMIWRTLCCLPPPKPAAGSPRLTFSQILPIDNIFHLLSVCGSRELPTPVQFHWCQWYFSWFTQMKWNGNWIQALRGHTLPFATPSHWDRKLDSECSYSYGKGTSSKKKYSYISKSWLSLSLMHLQLIEFYRKPFPGSI